LLLRANVSFQLGPEIVELSTYVSQLTIRPAAAAGLELVRAPCDDVLVLESFVVLARLIDAYGNAAEPLGALQAAVRARIRGAATALELALGGALLIAHRSRCVRAWLHTISTVASVCTGVVQVSTASAWLNFTNVFVAPPVLASGWETEADRAGSPSTLFELLVTETTLGLGPVTSTVVRVFTPDAPRLAFLQGPPVMAIAGHYLEPGPLVAGESTIDPRPTEYPNPPRARKRAAYHSPFGLCSES
jgi:hypothetical protein